MLQNAYFLAKIGADTAEIELHFAEMLPIGHRVIRPTEVGAGAAGAGARARAPGPEGRAREEVGRDPQVNRFREMHAVQKGSQ